MEMPRCSLRMSASRRGGCKAGDAAHENAFIVTSSASARARTRLRFLPGGRSIACSRKSSISRCSVWLKTGPVSDITISLCRRERNNLSATDAYGQSPAGDADQPLKSLRVPDCAISTESVFATIPRPVPAPLGARTLRPFRPGNYALPRFDGRGFGSFPPATFCLAVAPAFRDRPKGPRSVPLSPDPTPYAPACDTCSLLLTGRRLVLYSSSKNSIIRMTESLKWFIFSTRPG